MAKARTVNIKNTQHILFIWDIISYFEPNYSFPSLAVGKATLTEANPGAKNTF